MPELSTLVAPSHTAVLTMEVQRGVVGDLPSLPLLSNAIRDTPLLANIGRICGAAREVGAAVVHCTAEFRADRRGTAVNCRLMTLSKSPGHMVAGSPGVEVVPEVGLAPSDLVVPRHHGVSPFSGTELDATVRALGATTVVAIGASVNIGITGMVIEAVNLGYQVVVPRDAVAGVPAEYADAVIDNSLALLATITTTDDLLACWV
jgi:nicotinamidase-related amidase